MSIPEIPAAFQLPWPWDPSERARKSNEYFELVIASSSFEASDIADLRETCRRGEEQFVIPSHAAHALRKTLFTLLHGEFDGRNDALCTPLTQSEHIEMMKGFEQNHLGLPPTDSTTGLRWWASNAGFASGMYPIGPIAASVSLDAEKLHRMIKPQGNETPEILLKSGAYLHDVHHTEYQDTVRIGEVTTLTQLGSTVLESCLQAYAIGHNTNLWNVSNYR